MPYIQVKTNIEIKDKEYLKSLLGQLVTIIPGKSEARLMVSLYEKESLYFGGSDAPCCMVETLVNPGTDFSCNEAYCKALIENVSKALDIPEHRFFTTIDKQEFWYAKR